MLIGIGIGLVFTGVFVGGVFGFALGQRSILKMIGEK
jgi:hypothetical protein